MSEQSKTLAKIAADVEAQLPGDGLFNTALEHVMLYRESNATRDDHQIYEPVLIFSVQGKKRVEINGQRFAYAPGQLFGVFMPMAMVCEMLDVSAEKPMLAVGVRIARERLARLLLKMDNIAPAPAVRACEDQSGVLMSSVSEAMLDAIARLVRTLSDPLEASVVGDAIVDEIYYRMLAHERGGALRLLLQQQGQMQQIARAVEYLTNNLTRNVSIDELAEQAHMSSSGFHKKFKQVMHVSPLQYIKSIRLNRARMFILEGAKANEACYRVGYNSPAQFSREYKRQFGCAPSMTDPMTA
ncbi:MAG: AraC family transcriptional regulator [Pseudomonadota bacterium]